MIQYNDFTELPNRFQRFLSSKLNEGESILAAWQPNSKEYQEHQLQIQMLGSVFFLIAYVIFWGFGAPSSALDRLSPENLNWIVCVFCFFFALGGAYLILMPIWAWSWARRTLYLFTNQRAVIVDSKNHLYGFRFQAFEGKALLKAKTTFPKGRVNIIFSVYRYVEDGNQFSEGIGFFGITNPDLAVKLLNELKSKVDSST